MSEKNPQWIREWKTCKHSELADSFHCISSEDEPVLTRCTTFYLSKQSWGEMMKKNLENIRIHMAIKREEGKDPAFIPIIQNFDKDSGKEGPFVCFTEEPLKSFKTFAGNSEADDSSEISEALKKELVKNWLYLHPGYIADQFETVEEVIGGKNQMKNGEKKPYNPRDIETLIRKRVNYYFYDAKDVKKMMDISGNINNVIFHMAVNHNDDRFGIPSFTPVLQFIYKPNSSSKNKVSVIESSLFFEFATPCPPLCSGDNL